MRRYWLQLMTCLVAMPLLSAQSRPPIVSSVDLQVPVPPVLVPLAGQQVLAYELHITNFQNVDVALSGLRVFGDAGSGSAIADYGGPELRQRLGRPGLSRQHATPEVIGPGMRAVVFFWIELPAGSPLPRAVRHRLGLELRRPAGAVRTVVDGAEVPVLADAPLALDPPVRGGPWTAIYDPLLMGGHRTAFYGVDGRARIPARFAVDFVRLPQAGALELDATRRSPDWNGYGAEVLAVADGTVAAAMDDIAENADPPVTPAMPMPPENASGNYVSLDLGGGRYAFYEHLRRGSVVVKAGDRVTRGQVIARLGNSGSSSIGPHLHFHVADANATLGAEGLPFVFRQFEVLGGFSSIAAVHAGERFAPVAAGPAQVRRLERPAPNAVLRFR